VNHQFFMIWIDESGDKSWLGPHERIDEAKSTVPDTASASMIAIPLPAMILGEKREALSILYLTAER
jgi:hypothetical protein